MAGTHCVHTKDSCTITRVALFNMFLACLSKWDYFRVEARETGREWDYPSYLLLPFRQLVSSFNLRIILFERTWLRERISGAFRRWKLKQTFVFCASSVTIIVEECRLTPGAATVLACFKKNKNRKLDGAASSDKSVLNGPDTPVLKLLRLLLFKTIQGSWKLDRRLKNDSIGHGLKFILSHRWWGLY